MAARVVNLGEPISSIPQYLATMNNWMPQIDHDMVLINIFAVNDLGELSRDELQDDGYLNRILGDLFVDVQTGRKRLDHVPHMFPLRVLDYLHTLYSYFRDGAFVHRSVPPPYTLAHGPVSPEVFVRVVANDLAICALESRDSHGPALDRVAQLARVLSDLKARGKRVLITISPGEVQINPTLFHEAVARQNADPANYDLDLPNTMVRETIQAVDPSLEVFDLTPLLREAMARGNNPYYPSDAHWNVDGNRIVGEALAERIGRP
ncbi:alginate O-acetyltransferase AlgX-related protein [Desulfolutivibrio sp.]|uniref:alginate O-acetyltransferase AlgX-related protein n=1 Tax=Desulfolutivibrio sp. TaxID=2773296 RepID=UPI002F96BE03